MLAWSVALLLCLTGVAVEAQPLRDPTQLPAQAHSAASATPAQVSAPELTAMTIIVRGGRPYLAVGTRLYAQGDKLGAARIERITETEVWLREGSALRKVSQFRGIVRRRPVARKAGEARFSVPTVNTKMSEQLNLDSSVGR